MTLSSKLTVIQTIKEYKKNSVNEIFHFVFTLIYFEFHI